MKFLLNDYASDERLVLNADTEREAQLKAVNYLLDNGLEWYTLEENYEFNLTDITEIKEI